MLIVYPVLPGKGVRFFSERVTPRELAHVDTKTTPTGLVSSTYRYVGSPRGAA